MQADQYQDPPEYRGGGMNFAMPAITPAVKLLLIANIVIFLLSYIFLFSETEGGGGEAYRATIDFFALSPQVWKDWFPFVPLWQLVTYGFMHQGLGHLLGNMLFLFFLGTMLEGAIGTRRFVVFYFVSIIGAGFCQLVLGLFTSPAPILGASGGVLAIVCGMATLRPTTRIIFILFPITLKTLALMYVAFDLFNVLGQLKGGGSNVASIAHLTGAAIGFFAVRTGWIWRDPVATLERVREERAAETEVDQRAKLDALLAKIAKEGIGSLSGREKTFLKKMSKHQ